MNDKNKTNRPEPWIAKKMKPELRDRYRKLRQMRDKPLVDEILVNHEIGTAFIEVRANRSTYGEKAATQLAHALQLSDRTCYRYITVAKTWDRDQIRELVKRRTVNGDHIQWMHLVHVSSLDHDERKQLLEEIFAEGLSTCCTEDRLRRPMPKKIRPKSPKAALVSLECVGKNMLEACEFIDDTVFNEMYDKMDDNGKVSVDTKLMGPFNKTIGVVETVQESIAKTLKTLTAYRQRIQDALDEEAKRDKSPQTPAFRREVTRTRTPETSTAA